MPVAPSGLYVETWQAGSQHDVSDDLLRNLIEAGAVEIVMNKAVQSVPETKRRRTKSNAV
jgi:hypothetical protein